MPSAVRRVSFVFARANIIKIMAKAGMNFALVARDGMGGAERGAKFVEGKEDRGIVFGDG